MELILKTGTQREQDSKPGILKVAIPAIYHALSDLTNLGIVDHLLKRWLGFSILVILVELLI